MKIWVQDENRTHYLRITSVFKVIEPKDAWSKVHILLRRERSLNPVEHHWTEVDVLQMFSESMGSCRVFFAKFTDVVKYITTHEFTSSFAPFESTANMRSDNLSQFSFFFDELQLHSCRRAIQRQNHYKMPIWRIDLFSHDWRPLCQFARPRNRSHILV